MISNSIFGCCKGFSSVTDSEGTYSAIFKNNTIKTKKYNTMNSPKASLKTTSTHRSNRNAQSAILSSQIHLIETTDLTSQIIPIMVKPSSSTIISSERYVCDKTNREVYLTPSITKQMIRTPSAPKQKVHFFYHNPRNPENRLTLSNIPSHSIDNSNSMTIVEKQKIWEELETCQNEPNMLTQSKNKGQAKGGKNQPKKIISNVSKHPMLTSKLHLGGSKFTVLSEGELEQIQIEEKEVKLEQSAIIVNVFNPTNSQIQKWQLHHPNSKAHLEKKDYPKVL